MLLLAEAMPVASGAEGQNAQTISGIMIIPAMQTQSLIRQVFLLAAAGAVLAADAVVGVLIIIFLSP